jgi:2-deoxy-D-gluconate 3-dehydrogenase
MTTKTIAQLFNLTGSTALVTGGALGIGKAIVDRLSEAGAAVVIADINEKDSLETVAQLQRSGRKVSFIKTDIRNLAEIQAAVDFTVKQYGSLDILVNNAGIFPFSPALYIDEENWDRVLDINLKGAFFMAQKAAAKMLEGGKGGKIINLASIDAFHPTGNLVHYDASKGGIVMLTKSLALEWSKSSITVNGIAPGGIKTPGVQQTSASMTKAAGLTPEQGAAMSKSFTAHIPLGRQGEADEIATVALFLASPAASYITGEIIVVDGGYLLG